MENNNPDYGQEAHNNPKQKLSYFESLNHVESRNIVNDKASKTPQNYSNVKELTKEARTSESISQLSPEDGRDKNISPDSNSYNANQNSEDSVSPNPIDFEDTENSQEDAFRAPGL